MNKKMRELLAKMKALQSEAEKYLGEGKNEEAKNKLREVQEVKALYESEKTLYEIEKNAANPPEGEPTPKDTADGFTVINKMLRRKPLTEAENALLTAGTSGESYLLPKDVDLAIREARESCMSLKELVTVYPITCLSGTAIYDDAGSELLASYTDDGTADISTASNPTFSQKTWTVSWYGRMFPVSNFLLGAEKSALMAYINRWFTRKAVKTENAQIIAALKKDITPTTIKGLDGIKAQLNAIDPDYMTDSVILTNQSGFTVLENETDAVGRSLLQDDITLPGRKKYNGIPIVVVSDSTLPNVGSSSAKPPVFIGSIKSGCAFYDYQSLQFDVSEHALFAKNQVAMRIIEGFAVTQEFTQAYKYCLLSPADTKKVVTTVDGTVTTKASS